MCRILDIEKPDFLIHLGDHARDVECLRQQYPFLPIRNVKGNCDLGDFDTPECIFVSYGSIRVMAAHGHHYGVKNSLLRILMAAKESAVHVALFGHTHCAYCELKDGIWLLNPGSCSNRSEGSYAIMEIVDGKLNCYLNRLNEME